MSDSTGVGPPERESGTRLGSRVHDEGEEIERLRREQGELWQWVQRLERLAEAGLHARGLAHDLGNTLTSLLTGSELALMQHEEGEMRRALETNLRLAREATRRLRVFRRLAGHPEPEAPSDARLVEVVREALTLLAHPLRKAEIVLVERLRSVSCVPGSHLELLQVVGTTLLAVVRGFEGFKGPLEIELDDRDEEVLLTVRRGVPTGPAPVDDRWWAHGPGLELTVARRIVAGLGGRLDVDAGTPVAVLALPRMGAAAAPGSWHEAPGAFAPHRRPAGGTPRRP